MKFLALIAAVAAQTACADDTECADVTGFESCCPLTDDDTTSNCSDGTVDEADAAVTCPEEETESASKVVLGAAALLAAAQMF